MISFSPVHQISHRCSDKTIRETSERLVSGVVLKYGKDSREYEMTGRVRKSDACVGVACRRHCILEDGDYHKKEYSV
ncbi:hypothetical protein [Nostoc sp. UIC 10630]|uniref:hypothetical protein n=1 Tax=Nostoc sp. UIC 10630 TaxID=2100146 RepID=UPI0013D1FABB|nr:hypothetical protein [Nostoc sp. UIC 10630]NEU79807.1 hypothetical protein [Nostoc sp. UIC 10630]